MFTCVRRYEHHILVVENPISRCSDSEKPQYVIWGVFKQTVLFKQLIQVSDHSVVLSAQARQTQVTEVVIRIMINNMLLIYMLK